MNKFILIIIVNFQLLDKPKIMEFRLKQNSYVKCINKANELKNSMKFFNNLIKFNFKCIPDYKDDNFKKI